MSKFKFPSIKLGNLFKREEWGEIIHEEWDETTTGNNKATSNVSATGKYQNPDLPLEEQLNIAKQKLELYRKSLPNLKK
jgi:hypothetical protein